MLFKIQIKFSNSVSFPSSGTYRLVVIIPLVTDILLIFSVFPSFLICVVYFVKFSRYQFKLFFSSTVLNVLLSPSNEFFISGITFFISVIGHFIVSIRFFLIPYLFALFILFFCIPKYVLIAILKSLSAYSSISIISGYISIDRFLFFFMIWVMLSCFTYFATLDYMLNIMGAVL